MPNKFQPGEKAPCAGLYKALHAFHAPPHEVTVLFGETFPRCLNCGDNVRFELSMLSVHVYAHSFFAHEI